MRRVSFTQSGGFVGVVRSCRIEVALLAAEERTSLEQLVAASGLEASCECLSENCRDGRTYEIVIEHETKVVRAVFDETSLPEAARPLVSFLKARATPGMR
jgi:hypothetical protein